MSHFYATIKGNRGAASRCGTASSGIHGHIRGWEVGAEVSCYHEHGQDLVCINVTDGSRGRDHPVPLATVEYDGKIVLHPHPAVLDAAKRLLAAHWIHE